VDALRQTTTTTTTPPLLSAPTYMSDIALYPFAHRQRRGGDCLGWRPAQPEGVGLEEGSADEGPLGYLREMTSTSIFDHHLSSSPSANAVTKVPCRVVYITLLGA